MVAVDSKLSSNPLLQTPVSFPDPKRDLAKKSYFKANKEALIAGGILSALGTTYLTYQYFRAKPFFTQSSAVSSLNWAGAAFAILGITGLASYFTCSKEHISKPKKYLPEKRDETDLLEQIRNPKDAIIPFQTYQEILDQLTLCQADRLGFDQLSDIQKEMFRSLVFFIQKKLDDIINNEQVDENFSTFLWASYYLILYMDQNSIFELAKTAINLPTIFNENRSAVDEVFNRIVGHALRNQDSSLRFISYCLKNKEECNSRNTDIVCKRMINNSKGCLHILRSKQQQLDVLKKEIPNLLDIKYQTIVIFTWYLNSLTLPLNSEQQEVIQLFIADIRDHLISLGKEDQRDENLALIIQDSFSLLWNLDKKAALEIANIVFPYTQENVKNNSIKIYKQIIDVALQNHEIDIPLTIDCIKKSKKYDRQNIYWPVVQSHLEYYFTLADMPILIEFLEECQKLNDDLKFLSISFQLSDHIPFSIGSPLKKEKQTKTRITEILDTLIDQGKGDLVFSLIDKVPKKLEQRMLDYVIPVEKLSPEQLKELIQMFEDSEQADDSIEEVLSLKS